MAVGFVERDGLAVLAGQMAGALSWGYLWLWWEVASTVLHRFVSG